MRLPTQRLIQKIEHLSAELSPKQLIQLLDIIDAMAELAKESKAVAAQSSHAQSNSTKHLTKCVH